MFQVTVWYQKIHHWLVAHKVLGLPHTVLPSKIRSSTWQTVRFVEAIGWWSKDVGSRFSTKYPRPKMPEDLEWQFWELSQKSSKIWTNSYDILGGNDGLIMLLAKLSVILEDRHHPSRSMFNILKRLLRTRQACITSTTNGERKSELSGLTELERNWPSTKITWF